MIRQLKYILFVFLVISCKNNTIEKPKKPSNLIAKDKMVEIIYDISLFTAAKSVNKYPIESAGILPENYIYNKYNIDSLQFALSNEFYAYNLKTYEDIYNSVKIKLEKDKNHFNAIIEAEKKVKDSINKKVRREFDSLGVRKKLNRKNRKLKRKTTNRNPLKKTDTSQISTHQQV